MLVLATTSSKDALEEQQLTRAFPGDLHVDHLTTAQQISTVLEEDGRLSPKEIAAIEEQVAQKWLVHTFNLSLLLFYLSSDTFVESSRLGQNS